jgi:hypothetical protein
MTMLAQDRGAPTAENLLPDEKPPAFCNRRRRNGLPFLKLCRRSSTWKNMRGNRWRPASSAGRILSRKMRGNVS